MKKYSFLMVILLMILSACGSDKDSSTQSAGGLQGVLSSSTDETTSARDTDSDTTEQVYSIVDSIPDPVDQNFIMPQIDGLDGRLLFVQGNTVNQSPNLGSVGRIYLASFDGSAPVQLAEKVSEPSVMVSPDGSTVGYAAVDGLNWYMCIMDLDTLEPIQLGHLSKRFGFI